MICITLAIAYRSTVCGYTPVSGPSFWDRGFKLRMAKNSAPPVTCGLHSLSRGPQIMEELEVVLTLHGLDKEIDASGMVRGSDCDQHKHFGLC